MGVDILIVLQLLRSIDKLLIHLSSTQDQTASAGDASLFILTVPTLCIYLGDEYVCLLQYRRSRSWYR